MEQTAGVYGNKIALPLWVKDLRCIYSQSNEKGIYEIVKCLLNTIKMKIKYIITEERDRLWTGEESKKVIKFDVNIEIEGISPKEMPSDLLTQRVEAVQTTLIRSFLEQEKKYEDGLKIDRVPAPRDISQPS